MSAPAPLAEAVAPETTVVERHGRAIPFQSTDVAHALRVAENWSEIAADADRC
jgi:hypothetical protein